jgi:hypothetical protein
MDKPFYCLDLEKEKSFLQWNDELAASLKKNNRYTSGITAFMKKENTNTVYMISIQSPEKILRLDSLIKLNFQMELIERRDDAIERGSNLYLYKITSN